MTGAGATGLGAKAGTPSFSVDRLEQAEPRTQAVHVGHEEPGAGASCAATCQQSASRGGAESCSVLFGQDLEG